MVGERYGWNAVILVNAAVTVCGVAAYLFVATNQPLKTSTAESLSASLGT
jgi:uncharacterized membrane protein YadS